MRILPALIILSFCWQLSAQPQRAVLAQYVQRVLETAEDAEYLPIYLLLADQVEVAQLGRYLQDQGVPVSKRPKQLIAQLKTKASSSQASLLQRLRHSSQARHSSIRSYWIANIVFAEVQKELLIRLSQSSDIAWIGYNGEVELEAFDRNCAAPLLMEEDGIELGLAAIQAPLLWRMGYTGYGQKALIIDTGTDTEHPALQTKFMGNFGPLSAAWFDTDPTQPFDCNDHGTHVCGTILGLDRLHNDTIGVAFNANWMASPPISCYRNADFKGTERIIASFQWALDPDGNPATTEDMPDVINNSWYDPHIDTLDCVSAYVPVFNALEAAGVAVVFSAGNEGPDPMTITPPHNINTDIVNSFTVGALNGNVPGLGIANFSSRGPSQCGGQSSLLIKPEVSAPGESVRSSVRNGGYDYFSGTSMASPHVCGAILLLKEAFPELSGHQFKEALYFSARDLGDPGEDNTYGMGIIDVMEAYNYLINEGHVPLLPEVTTDLMLIGVELDKKYCGGSVQSALHVENAGQTDISAFDIRYQLSGSDIRIHNILWQQTTLAAGERAQVNLPDIDNLPAGKYEVYLQLTLLNGQTEDRLQNNEYRRFIEVFEEVPVAVEAIGLPDLEACTNAAVVLSAAQPDEGEIRWYDQWQGGNLLHSGPSFMAPPAMDDTTYFVDHIQAGGAGISELDWQSAPLDDDIAGELYFNTFTPFTLKSVKVYSELPGPRVIYLKNYRNVTISSKLFLLGIGEHVLDLNFEVPVGNDHYLQLTEGRPLYYSDTDVQFPYEVPGVLSIERSNDAADPTGRYYYFYDWQIEYGQPCGRTAVPLARSDNDSLPQIATESDDTEIYLENGLAAAEFTAIPGTEVTDYFWDFGDGSASLSNQSPVSHNFEAAGKYLVSCTAVNGEGCSQAAGLEVVVHEVVVATQPIPAETEILVFPNPVSTQLFIQATDNQLIIHDVQLVDMLGRSLLKAANPSSSYQLDVQHLEAGIYFARLTLGTQKLVRRFVKTN